MSSSSLSRDSRHKDEIQELERSREVISSTNTNLKQEADLREVSSPMRSSFRSENNQQMHHEGYDQDVDSESSLEDDGIQISEECPICSDLFAKFGIGQ
jgi:hypothetical protein